ncbi:MAG TPA: RICIN domain-containing protein [Bryobacteraceae bacterium]|nr:RICIN domain-containing protein [Bryobacteraceae bacterium]
MKISGFQAAISRGVVPELLARTGKVAKTKNEATNSALYAVAVALLVLSVPAMANALTVKDYGAKGNGVTDDTEAIQRAVNSTPSGALEFPNGTYKLTKAVNLLSGVHYQGKNAVIKGTGKFWLFQTAWNAANNTISGFTFDNGGINLAGTVTGITITGNTFQNLTGNNSGGNWTLGNAIFAGGGGIRSSKISGNTFKNLLVDGSPEPNGNIDAGNNQAMHLYGVDSTSIDHNTFDHIGEAIGICFTNTYESNNVYIGYNTFTNIHRMGMEIQGPMGCGRSKPVLNGPDTHNIVIEYNSFTNPLDPYWWTYPISLANPAPSGGSGAIVRYNYLVSALPKYGMNGPNGYGIESGSSNMQIYGNTVVGPWGTGITYDGSPNSTIHDNFLCGIAQGAKAGIRWETRESANVSIKNNEMHPNGCPAQIPNPTKLTPEPASPPVSKPDPAPISGPIANGDYTIANVYNGLVLDDPAFSVSSLQIIQWPTNGGENQKWQFVFDGAGYYTIENAYSGLYLTDDGAGKLIQALPSNNGSQLWSLKRSGSNYILQNKLTGKVIDAPNFDRSPNVGIVTWAANGGQNQLWAIK